MMPITRRVLLKTTALSLAGLVAAEAISATGAEANASSGLLVVGDSRFPASANFAEQQAPGAWFDARHDAATLWYQQLRQRVAASGSITGMTSAADLTILSGLARANGFKLTWQQRQAGSSVLVSWLISSRS